MKHQKSGGRKARRSLLCGGCSWAAVPALDALFPSCDVRKRICPSLCDYSFLAHLATHDQDIELLPLYMVKTSWNTRRLSGANSLWLGKGPRQKRGTQRHLPNATSICMLLWPYLLITVFMLFLGTEFSWQKELGENDSTCREPGFIELFWELAVEYYITASLFLNLFNQFPLLINTNCTFYSLY